MVEEIRNRGASLVAISPQKPEFLMDVVRENHIRFNLLFDEDNVVAREYNLAWTLPKDLREIYLEFGLDLEKYNGNAKWELPMPARFVIDRAGVVRESKVSPDHTERPEPATVLDVLDGLERA